MKLKKIASLALAGALAVSMLAGCSVKPGTSTDDTTVVTGSATSVVAAVNDGQAASNKVKVNFASDADLEAAVQKVVKLAGLSNMTSGVENYIASYVAEIMAEDYLSDADDLWNAETKPEAYPKDSANVVEKLDGEEQTLLKVFVIDSTEAVTEKAALKIAGEDVNAVVESLAERTAEVPSGKKYYTYSYEGGVSMTTVAHSNGTTSYIVAMTITQTAAEKEA